MKAFLFFFLWLTRSPLRLLHEKLVKTWGGFLKPGELIVKIGFVYKRRKLSIKKRMMILTSTPRLFYVDAKKMVLKGDIPLDGEFEIQVRQKTLLDFFLLKKNQKIKNDTAFTIYVPARKRLYILEDLERDSSSVDWREKILSSKKKAE